MAPYAGAKKLVADSSTNDATTSPQSGRLPASPAIATGTSTIAAHEVGGDHQPLSAEAVGGEAAVQAEEERRDAVGQAHRDHAAGAADVEREPHQGDVVERVAELARGDGEIHAPEVAAAQQVDCARSSAAPTRARAGRRRPDRTRSSEYRGTTMRGVTATRSLTGDDLRLEDVWAVAVDGAPAGGLGDEARRAHARGARRGGARGARRAASTPTASTPGSAGSCRARSRKS